MFVGRAWELAPAQFGVPPLGSGESNAALPARTALLDEPTLTLDLGKQATMKLALIPAGKFLMGSRADEAGRDEDEGPQREVVLSKPFYMGVHEVTQGQYEAVMGDNPSKFIDAAKPVECVSWDGCGRVLPETLAQDAPDCRAADGGPVGICVPGRVEDAVRFRRRRPAAFRLRAVRPRRGGGDRSGGFEEAQCVGSVRHARQCLGMVRRLVCQFLRQCRDPRSRWDRSRASGACCGAAPGPTPWEGCRCATRNKSTPDVRYNGIGFRVVVNSR